MATDAPRILVLADCGPEVGGGHVMRCLALAQALMAKGAACAFLAPPAVARVLDAFAPSGLERRSIADGPLHDLIEAGVREADAWAATAVLVDHYQVRAPQERLLRGGGRRILCIDDLADRPHDCDVLIDPTLGREPGAYAALTSRGCTLLAGPEHALLWPQYAEARKAALARRNPVDPPRRLLVSLGLMDLRGVTGRVMRLVAPGLDGIEADVVVGSGAASLTWLGRLAAQNPRIRLHVDTRDMAGLIATADIGIGAGGASAWERATLGLPSLNLVLAENQQALTQELDRRGASLAVDVRDRSFAEALPAAFQRLRSEGELRASLSRVSAALSDGAGAERAADAILRVLA
jgi:UDP-2,4-diacetamido-2,4,6-trideoxy-beta-L-altropyranose hydrolase